MKRFGVIILTVLMVCCVLSASADTLYVNGMERRTILQSGPDSVEEATARWYDAWTARHPETKLSVSSQAGYRDTAALIRGLQKKNAKWDVLALSTADFDLRQAMRSGVLADLTGDEALRAAVDAMHPALQDAARQDGRLYGVPCGLTFGSFLSYDEAAMAQAGFRREDAPGSLTALLDFLERWAASPAENVCVTDTFEEKTYWAGSYTTFLTELLLEQYVQQRAARGLDGTFATPELIALLERASSVGAALYEADRPFSGGPCLFRVTSVPRNIPYLIPGRLAESDPLLIPVQVRLLCVSAASSHPEEAAAFVRTVTALTRQPTGGETVTAEDAETALTHALLYTDATGDVISDRGGWYEQYVQDTVAKYEAIAADPTQSKKKRENAQARLERYARENWVENASKARYQLTAEELAVYQGYAGSLCVVTPDLTVVSSKATRSLVKRFAAGRITARELAEGLDAQRR